MYESYNFNKRGNTETYFFQYKEFWIVVGIIAAIFLFITLLSMSINNSAVNKEEAIYGAKSDIQVREKRRHDLLLGMANVLEENMRYEEGVLTKITELRTAIDNAELGKADTILKFFVENYPTLGANEQFKNLMLEYSITENMIKEAREYYNDSVKDYRAFVRRFPNRIFISDPKEFPYLEYNSEETQPPVLFPKK